MKQENIYKITPIFISVFVFCFAIAFYALGWTEPTVAPPGGTVDVPLNVGNIGQSKAGGLILNTGGAANGLIVQNGKVGIGTTTPAYVLDVRGTSSPLVGLAGGALQVNAVPPAGQTAPVDAIKILGPNSPMNSNSSQNLKWSFSAAGSSLIRSYRGGSWDTYLQFLTNSSSAGGDNPQVRMTINGDGRVGVNTTTPNVNYGSYLDVNGALHWGTASLRGFLLVDGGSSIELGGSGTPYIDISNDNSATGVNDYDVRLILENDNLLRIAGGDVCLDATYGSKCLSTAGGGAPTLLANNLSYAVNTVVPAGTCSLIVIDTVLEGTRVGWEDGYGELVLTFYLNGSPLNNDLLKKISNRTGDHGHGWHYGDWTSRRIYIANPVGGQTISATLVDTAGKYSDEDATYTVICY